jgi:hypothetical protein
MIKLLLLGTFCAEEFQEILLKGNCIFRDIAVVSLRLSLFAPQNRRKNAPRVREHAIYSRYISPCRASPRKDDVLIASLSPSFAAFPSLFLASSRFDRRAAKSLYRGNIATELPSFSYIKRTNLFRCAGCM